MTRLPTNSLELGFLEAAARKSKKKLDDNRAVPAPATLTGEEKDAVNYKGRSGGNAPGSYNTNLNPKVRDFLRRSESIRRKKKEITKIEGRTKEA